MMAGLAVDMDVFSLSWALLMWNKEKFLYHDSDANMSLQ